MNCPIVLKNTLFMSLSTALRMLTSVVLFVVMARTLGPSQFGAFVYWLTVASLLILIVDYGFGQHLMRSVGSKPGRAGVFVSGVLAAKLLLSAAVVVVIAAVSVTPWGRQQPLPLIWTLLSAAILNSFAETFNAAFRGLGKYHKETTIAAWTHFTHFAAVMILMWLQFGIEGIAFVFLASRAMFLVLALQAFREAVPGGLSLRLAGDFSVAVRELKAGFAFAADAFFTNFQAQADTLIIRYFLGIDAVGTYQAGMRLMQGANNFSQVLSNVYLPSMASTAANPPQLRLLSNRLFSQMLMLGAFSVLVFGFGAQTITHLLYGERYHDLIVLLPWFGVLSLARFLVASQGIILSAVGLQSMRVAAIAIGFVALFAGTFFLLPRFGLLGMLFALILSMACVGTVYAFMLARHGFPQGLSRLNAAALAAVVGMSWLTVSRS